MRTGLAAGDRVVRAGHQKIFPGAKVLPVASLPPAKAADGAAPTSGEGATEAKQAEKKGSR